METLKVKEKKNQLRGNSFTELRATDGGKIKIVLRCCFAFCTIAVIFGGRALRTGNDGQL